MRVAAPMSNPSECGASPCRNLAAFRCACCKFGYCSGKVCKESNRNTYKRCRSSVTPSDCCAQQVKSDCGRTAYRHSTGERAGTCNYKEILVGRVSCSYRTIQLVPTQLKHTGPRIATETRPIHNTDDMGIRVGLRTAPVAIMEEMRNARQT